MATTTSAAQPANPTGRAHPGRGDAGAGAGLDPAEAMGLDELRALQLERMRATLQRAYEAIPFYRKSFDAAGTHPSELRELADLSRFPFTRKSDLRDQYPFGMFAVPRERLARIHASMSPAV